MASKRRPSRGCSPGEPTEGPPEQDLGTSAHSTRRLLEGVAAALGMPTSAFLEGHTQLADQAETSELSRHWNGLRDRAARQRVLALVGAVATEASGGPKR